MEAYCLLVLQLRRYVSQSSAVNKLFPGQYLYVFVVMFSWKPRHAQYNDFLLYTEGFVISKQSSGGV